MVLPLSIHEDGGENVPITVRRAARLTSDAVGTLYPGIGTPVLEHVYGDVTGIAEAVVQWAEERL